MVALASVVAPVRLPARKDTALELVAAVALVALSIALYLDAPQAH
jgi:hypothetical protein